MTFIIPLKQIRTAEHRCVRVSFLDYEDVDHPIVFSYETSNRVVKTVHIPLISILSFWERLERVIKKLDETPPA